MRSTWRFVVSALAALGIAGFLVAVALFSVAIQTRDPRAADDWITSAVVAFLVTMVVHYLQFFAAMGWMHQAYSWLPSDQRYSRHWKSWISPSTAALLLLVPYFQYYWMFVVNTGLCDALDRLRVRYPTQTPAPKQLAIIACIMQLIVPIPVGSILWMIYMSKIESITREMSAAR